MESSLKGAKRPTMPRQAGPHRCRFPACQIRPAVGAVAEKIPDDNSKQGRSLFLTWRASVHLESLAHWRHQRRILSGLHASQRHAATANKDVPGSRARRTRTRTVDKVLGLGITGSTLRPYLRRVLNLGRLTVDIHDALSTTIL